MEPKSASGAPWEGEISLGNSPGAPPEVHHEFFFRLRRPPGAIWEPPGRAKKGFHVALLVFSASGRLRGAILEQFWLDFGAFFGAFLKRF